MKTKEELSTIKNEVESLNKKLSELSEDEMRFVVGGGSHEIAETLIEGLMGVAPNPGVILVTGQQKEQKN